MQAAFRISALIRLAALAGMPALGADCLSFSIPGLTHPSSMAIADTAYVTLANACAAEAPVDSVWVGQRDSTGDRMGSRFTYFGFSEWDATRSRKVGGLEMERFGMAPSAARENLYYKAPDTSSRIWQKDSVALAVPANGRRILGGFRLSWVCPVCKISAAAKPGAATITVIFFSRSERDTLQVDFPKRDIAVAITAATPARSSAGDPARHPRLINGKRACGAGVYRG